MAMDFKTYLTNQGIKHETSTPDWPQGNSEAETFVKPLSKAIRTAEVARKSQLGSSTFQLRIELSTHTTFLNEHLTCSASI